MFYRGTQNDVLAYGQGRAFTWGGASLNVATETLKRPLIVRESVQPPVGYGLTSRGTAPVSASAASSSWTRGNQAYIQAATHPLPFVRPGPFPSAAPVSLPYPPPPLLVGPQAQLWALTGVGVFWYPAPIPISVIPPQSVITLPQAVPDVPRSFTFVTPAFVIPQPPLILHTVTRQELPIETNKSLVFWPQPLSVVASQVLSVVTRQESVPDVPRSFQFTIPAVQAPAIGAAAISTRENRPPEIPTSFWWPGTYLKGKQYVLLQDAISDAVNLGFIVGQPTQWLHDANVPTGYVISQSIAPGTVETPYVPSGAQNPWPVITFTASLGPFYNTPVTIVPDVSSTPMQMGQALATVFAAQLVLGQNIFTYSATVPQGYTIAQSIAAGLAVDSGTSINLTISLGKQPVPNTITVPDFTRPPVAYPAQPGPQQVGSLLLEIGGYLLSEDGQRLDL